MPHRRIMPFHVVTLTHGDWDAALACARSLDEDALPELRLDLFPELDPTALVAALDGCCLVTCRRASEGGRWPDADEVGRLAHLLKALPAHPAWVDLEWDLPIPPELQAARAHTRLLRSVHVAPGVFDLDTRLAQLPEGDAHKWVGWAATLADNARLKAPLAWARDRGLLLAAFLMGPKGLPSRALQAAWGGAFTYAAPDDGPPAAPGQLPLATLRAWRSAELRRDHALCGVMGDPVLHSRGPAFHNLRFQRAHKDLIYLPLLCGEADEALAALDALEVLGLSITAPLKLSLPEALGLRGPLNTLWRRAPGAPWQGANTDAEAFDGALAALPEGPVLLLGEGGVAQTSRARLEAAGRPVLQASRRAPLTPAAVAAFAPVGVVQATSLGMKPEDPAPFPELLEAAEASARWAVEWIYKEDTAFSLWAADRGLQVVGGAALFDAQAEAQSLRFIKGCGGPRDQALDPSPAPGVPDVAPTLGAALRRAREAAGISREQLVQQLKLPLRHLEAMEADAWDRMPPGRARPLARQVAERLGVDVDAQVEAFQTVPGLPEEEPLDPQRDRMERLAMMGVGVASVLLVLWLVVPGPRLGKKLVSDRPGLLPGQGLPPPPPPSPSPYPVLGELIPEAPLNAEGILVSLRALDACNARIEPEGGAPQDHALRVSEPWRLRVKGPFTLTLDNAGVVNLEVAGHRVHHGQSVGQAWTGRFDAEGRWLRPVEPEVTDAPPTDDQEE